MQILLPKKQIVFSVKGLVKEFAIKNILTKKYSTSPLINLKPYLLLISVLTLMSCASSSFFVPYPSQMKTHKNNIIEGVPEASVETLSNKGSSGPNHILDVLEAARIAQIAKNYDASKKLFEEAFYLFEQFDAKAKLDISDGGSLLGSFALNDNALPYKPEAYERILAHHYQSLNYLALGNFQGALIEVRRATEEQVYAVEQHHKELAKAEAKAKDKELSPNLSDYKGLMEENFKAAAKVKDSFQNAYTFYYSGLIREMAGETNAAYIDYKKALELYPSNPYVQQDFWRLAKQLGMNSDMERYQSLIPNELKSHKNSASDTGEIVIFIEQNFIPEKQEVSLPFSSFTKFYTIAFPVYLKPWRASSPIDVSANEDYLGKTSEIVDLHAMAAKSLEEGSVKRLLRQMIRISAKARLQQEAINSGSGANAAVAQLFANAYSLISERADMRSWLSLPNKVQVARFTLPAGSHQIQLSNATFLETINVSISAGKKTIIRINHPGSQKIYLENFSE